MEKELSIIIVTYNSAQEIAGCLKSISVNNDIGDRLEVIIIDNNSSDFARMRSEADSAGISVQIIRNHRNSGYGEGNNMGIRRAAAPLVMVMNPDVRLVQPIFRAALRIFAGDSNLALAGGPQYEPDLKSQHSYFPIRINLRNMLVYKFDKLFGRYDQDKYCISGACFFVDKEKFEKAGMFDSGIFLYGEEIDINRRLTQSGHTIRFVKDLVHVHPLENRSHDPKAFERGMKSHLYLCDKFGWSKKRLLGDLISSLRIEQMRHLMHHGRLNPDISARIMELKHLLKTGDCLVK